MVHEENEVQKEENWDFFSITEADVQEALTILQGHLHEEPRFTGHQGEFENSIVRLPRVTIPIFDGTYRSWTSFHDIYVRMIHSQTKLGNVIKMQYLKCYMKGEASRLIQHLEISDNNYEAAWKLLCERYNNKRLILSTHLDNLLNQPTIIRESAQELKQLHDKTKEALQAVESLKIDVCSWGPLLTHIIVRKLDKDTCKLYEQSLSNSKEIPSFDKLLSFLEGRFQSLESMESINKKREFEKKILPQKVQQPFKAYNTTVTFKCTFCGGNHNMYRCTEQQAMSSKQKMDAVRKDKRCLNCLRKGHSLEKCKSKNSCLKCGNRHNTWLHDDSVTKGPQNFMQQAQNKSEVVTLATSNTRFPTQVLLATAVINIEATDGTRVKVKALIDQGSQASFISERAAQRLGLKRSKTNITVTGIHSQYKNSAHSCVTMKVSPRFESNFEATITAFILDKLTQFLPEVSTIDKQWHHLQHITLADPDYQKQGKIDIILGADVYGDIILDGILKGEKNSPLAQQTELGWIVSGRCGSSKCGNIRSMISKIDLDEIKRFWELEEITEPRALTNEENKCIEYFEKYVSRDKNGKFIVRLPFNKNHTSFTLSNNSKKVAISRLFHMERRFRRDKQLELEYKDFMKKYLELGHMKIASNIPNGNTQEWFLPHHAVIKENSKTTKLRVVFDASTKVANGESLNSNLYTGPQLQADLYKIMLQWRKYKFVFKADIEKMFRQIWIHEDDQPYQKIVWRFSEQDPIQEYQLTTVTYGTRPAPFLAVKTMQYLAVLRQGLYPNGAENVLNNFYMDDLLSGADTIEKARQAIYETSELLKEGGFPLRKWSSNHKHILKGIPSEQLEAEPSEVMFSDSIKTLGLHWSPQTDNFTFKVNAPNQAKEPTKRSLLSESAKLFDPIGWLAPTIIRAKLMFQELWNLGLDWDDKLPKEMANQWHEYSQELPLLEKLSIPRWVNHRTNASPSELHGFCDASEKAYAAVVYLKTYDTSGNTVIHLISAKTKVAPARKKVSLPRLELCGALLLTKLMQGIKEAMKIPFSRQYAWTDSEVVLAWINGDPGKYKTFVANRVSKIQDVLMKNYWYHVKSKENPADCASRGISATELINHQLWWEGPDWLKHSEAFYRVPFVKVTNEERKTAKLTFTTIINNTFIKELVERFSSLKKLIHTIAYCFRFISNCRGKKMKGPLTADEKQRTMEIIIKTTQEDEFAQELSALRKGLPLASKSFLVTLNPFCDENRVMRVGGRLENSELDYYEKHPIILPYKAHLTSLIIDEAHKETMHGGATLTLAHTRHRYWILKGHSAVKQRIRKCITCARYNARVHEQLMGNLPKPRLTLTRPFNDTGVDYAGPLNLKANKGRGTRMLKGYIAVFICMATKAIHLEAVSDLTAEAFIAAFKRFVGRRGIPRKIYSDNATNFQLASKILERNEAEFKNQYLCKLLEELSNYNMDWTFIPPAAPHFGGIWEAGVKSLKHHLRRTLGQTKLTFEELSTVLVSIEACLNSRPLCPLTSDPNNLSALTPGHFLIGTSLLAPPGKQVENINMKSRWQLLQQLHQQFWKKWSSEYLHRLQCRPKWTTKREELKINDLVLIKDEVLPPSQWSLGRIIELHPGTDNITRVVSVRTRNKVIKRPITKICILPVNEPQEEHNRPSTTGIKRSIQAEGSTVKEKRSKQGVKISPVTGYPNLIQGTKTKNSGTNHKVPRGPQLSSLTFFAMLTLLLIPALAETTTSFVNITPFNHHPGIFFEGLGETHLVVSEWSILVHYDLKHYWQELQGLRDAINGIEELCNKIVTQRNYCIAIYQQFERQLKQLEETNKLICGDNNKGRNDLRQKRSPLNIVGKAANYLFGILDADYAEELDRKFDQISQNEDHLLQLIKNQTSIMEATANIMKNREDSLQSQFKIINDHIKDLFQRIHQNKDNEETNRILHSLISHTTLVLYNYERVQRSLMDVLTDVHNGRINSLLITPSQLKQQLHLVRENIPNMLTLFGDKEESLVTLYSLMKATALVTTSRIIFHVKIPLLKNEKYQLYHLVPVPTPHQEEFTFIEPDTPYLIVNLHRDNYYPLTQSELDRCIQVKGRYLCHKNHPIYNDNSRRAQCELKLLKHIKDVSSDCHIRRMKPTKIWIQLRSPNTWLYVMDKEYSINIVCGSQLISKLLKGEGILRLTSNCEIKEETMTIGVHGLYSTYLNSSFTPSLNISHLLTQPLQKQEPSRQVEYHWQPNNAAYINLRQRLSELHKNEQLPTNLSPHDVHHYTVNYLLVTVILLIIIILICK